MNKIIRYLLQGILFTVPVAITFYIIISISKWVGMFVDFLGVSIHPIVDPLFGLIGGVLFLIMIGALSSSIFFYPIFNRIEQLIEKTPFLKIVYSSVKDLLSAFVGQKKKFNQPVIVKINENPPIERLGFITQNSLEDLHISENKVAVYFPLSYSLSGDLIIVSSSYVKPVPVPAAEFMKFIVSGGVTKIDEKDTN
ncbi:MAG: DUF502 domain-containing protein [Bacteroidia bacterium]|nr:DUF502 domain-containing protein [Bacteroidia bacterium]MCZ2248149.1 DUF502 domain-containing protein [Bacteroidia bacterium]